MDQWDKQKTTKFRWITQSSTKPEKMEKQLIIAESSFEKIKEKIRLRNKHQARKKYLIDTVSLKMPQALFQLLRTVPNCHKNTEE